MTGRNSNKLFRSLAGSILFAVALIELSTQVACATETNRPNVLFIMVDQLCADAMSCRMGTQYLRTPAMDSLAQHGETFTRAYCANPLCMPSRNSIFTGRYPHETKVTQNAKVKLDPAEFVNLGDYFTKPAIARPIWETTSLLQRG